MEVRHVPLRLQQRRRGIPVRVVVQRAHVEEARVEFQRDGRPVFQARRDEREMHLVETRESVILFVYLTRSSSSSLDACGA